jgi:hypothetical protein
VGLLATLRVNPVGNVGTGVGWHSHGLWSDVDHVPVDDHYSKVDANESGHKEYSEFDKLCVAVVCRVNGPVSRGITLHLPTLWTGGAATGLYSYSLPSINVYPREWIKVNIYRGVNS